MGRFTQFLRDSTGVDSYVCTKCYTSYGDEKRETCGECGGDVIEWDPEAFGPVPPTRDTD